MEERLVDVLDGYNRILHVFPVPAGEQASEADCVQHAVNEAAHLRLVSDTDVPSLHGRPHVSRGGRLAPVADVLQLRADAIRRRAYFLWLDEGRPSGCADRHWLEAERCHRAEVAA